MNSSIIISDASVPFALSFSDTVLRNGVSSIVLDTEKQWTPGSLLSAKTAVINAKKEYSHLNRALVCFDTKTFIESLQENDPAATLFERYITGYFYLCSALLNEFKKNQTGLLTFALRSFEKDLDQKNHEESPLCKTIHMAEAAFSVLAERTAAELSIGESSVSALMIRLDGEDDQLNAEWLYSRMYSEKPQKTQTRWIKAGSKNLLGLF